MPQQKTDLLQSESRVLPEEEHRRVPRLGDQPPLKARAKAALEAVHGSRRSVAGDHELAAVGMQIVKSVEKLLLSTGLARQELYVVDEQQLGRPVAAAELVRAALGDRGHKFVSELLGGNVDRFLVGFGGVLSDRLKKVSLAQARRAVDVKGIVIGAWAFRRTKRGRCSHAVALGDNEILKR